MTEYKKIIRIAFPSMIENFLQMLMGMIDGYLVAQVSLLAVSGVSIANNIIAVYQAIFIAIGAAVSSLVAKSVGQKDDKQLSNYVTQAVVLTVLVGIVLGAISIFLGERTLLLLGASTNLARLGSRFLAIVGGGIVLMGLMTTLGAIIRVTSNPRIPMYIGFYVNVINIILSIIAIFVLHLGVLGVGLSSVLSRLIGVLLLLSKQKVPFSKLTYRLDKNLISLVLPSAGERLMMRMGDVVIIAIIVVFGSDVVAGNAIGETITQFNYVSGMGVATAAVILVGQAVGKGTKKEIGHYLKKLYFSSVITMFLISVCVFLASPFLIGLYTNNTLASSAAGVVVIFSFISTPVTAGTYIYTATWQGLGNARLPFYATTIGMWGVRILLGYLCGVQMGLGLIGVWLATFLDNAFRFIYMHMMYKRKMKKMN